MPKTAQPTPLSKDSRIAGATFFDDHWFSRGHSAPIFEVETSHALNQLIGNAKFNNRHYGKVLYRGEPELHESLKPSAFRHGKRIGNAPCRIKQLVERVIDDDQLRRELKLNEDPTFSKDKVEGLLQHYGVRTRYIDLVDNHWIALWMGLNRAKTIKRIKKYCHYVEREILVGNLLQDVLPYFENTNRDKAVISNSIDPFQYILLVAVPFSDSSRLNSTTSQDGVYTSHNYIEIDLRKAIPSQFLRPHAQHGIVLRRKVHDEDQVKGSDAYDISPNVVGIIKVRIDRAKKWLGSGHLLTQENLFPPPAYDYGYDLLLLREDIFNQEGCEITRYI